MHTWRLETIIVTDDLTTHEQTRYREDRCGVCGQYAYYDDQQQLWVHYNRTELCHERAA